MGGNAFEDVGVIHKSEITPTLSYLAKILGISSLDEYIFGGTGKKEFSGDIDIVLPSEKYSGEFVGSKVTRLFGENNVKRYGSSLSISIPISGFNDSKNAENVQRTGKVQVDIMFDDPEWIKFYYFSPSEEASKYKGIHRNIAISSVAGYCHRNVQNCLLDNLERPVEYYRYKWSPKYGLVRVHRKSVFNKHTNRWNKNQRETIIGEPCYDPEKIANILFYNKLDVSYLESLESVINGIYLVYDGVKEEIFRQIAINFISHRRIRNEDQNFPEEIEKYIPEAKRICSRK